MPPPPGSFSPITCELHFPECPLLVCREGRAHPQLRWQSRRLHWHCLYLIDFRQGGTTMFEVYRFLGCSRRRLMFFIWKEELWSWHHRKINRTVTSVSRLTWLLWVLWTVITRSWQLEDLLSLWKIAVVRGRVHVTPSHSECPACVKDEETATQGGDWLKITKW